MYRVPTSLFHSQFPPTSPSSFLETPRSLLPVANQISFCDPTPIDEQLISSSIPQQHTVLLQSPFDTNNNIPPVALHPLSSFQQSQILSTDGFQGDPFFVGPIDLWPVWPPAQPIANSYSIHSPEQQHFNVPHQSPAFFGLRYDGDSLNTPESLHADSNLTAPQFGTTPFRRPGLYQVQSQTPLDLREPVEVDLDSKQSAKAMLWNYYLHTFHPDMSLVQECEEFKLEVGSRKNFQTGIRKRKDEGQWSCPLDRRTFTRKLNLRYHIQSHLGIRECGCTCGSTFIALSGLRRHQKKCPVVSSASATNSVAMVSGDCEVPVTLY